MKFRLVEIIKEQLVSLLIGYHLWINSQRKQWNYFTVYL